MSASLTASVLHRLTREAFVGLLGQAERFECALHPGSALILCHEPVADLNYVVAGPGAGEGDHHRRALQRCLELELPFLCFVFPGAGPEAEALARELGLSFAVEIPYMTHSEAIEPSGHDEVQVVRASGAEGAAASARVLSSAFRMPQDAVLRVMPPSLTEGPALDVFLALHDGVPVGTVTLTHHGDTTGVWAMGVDSSRQRGGLGRRLLSTAMAEARRGGARHIFLGSTPAGLRLYEGLGFRTRFATRVWARGETHQA